MNHYVATIQDLFNDIVLKAKLDLDTFIECTYKTGYELELPGNDYALIRGPEIMLECRFLDSIGQVFTVAPKSYSGRLADVLSLDLDNVFNRGLFYAVASAVLKHLGLVERTMHCRGCKPRECGKLLTRMLMERYGLSAKILHIGYQPGHVEELWCVYRDNLLVTDLSKDIVWRVKNNRLVYDGLDNNVYIGFVDVVVATASSIVNNTFWNILENTYIRSREIIVYGVTSVPLLKLLENKLPYKIEFFCPYSI